MTTDTNHSELAERQALAVLLDGRNPTAWPILIDIIRTPLAFYGRNERVIAIACEGLFTEGGLISAPTVADWLSNYTWGDITERMHELEQKAARKTKAREINHDESALNEIGGHPYVANVGSEFAPFAGLKRYAQTIADHHRQRQAMETASVFLDELKKQSGGKKSKELITGAISKLSDIESPDAGITTLADGAQTALQRHDDVRDRKASIRPALFGIRSLDEAMPLDPGTMTTLAAATGAGKTSLLLHVIEATARAYGPGSVALVSREMGVRELASVLIARHLHVPRKAIDRGHLMSGQREQADVIRKEIETWNAWIRDGMDCTAADAIGWARTLKRSTGGKLALLAVDHIGIISKAHKSQDNYSKVAEATGLFKSIARVLDIPVLLLAQMNRAGTKVERTKSGQTKPDPEPQLSDLKDSSTIEHDSDNVLFLYRPTADRGQVTAKVAKCRAGAQTRISLEFLAAEGQKFIDAVRDDHQQRLPTGNPTTRADRLASDPNQDEPPW